MPNDQFRVLLQVPRTKYDPISRENLEGFDITWQDIKTGTKDIMFVPNEQHNDQQVQALILAKLERIRAIANL